jgi:hypothetical protein
MDLEFGDAVWLKQPDGTEKLAHYLAGPRTHGGRQGSVSRRVIWVCDDHEWTNATVHFGGDPEGKPCSPERVRPYAPPPRD